MKMVLRQQKAGAQNKLFPETPYYPAFHLALMAVLACNYAYAAPEPSSSEKEFLDEVVVTAQKREQPVEDVPISMTVVDRKTMDNNHSVTLADIQQLVPNFSIAQLHGWNTISVRGVGGGGRNIGFDTRVGVYVDGVYIGQTQALDQALLDIEQVEVLRGPQGHLYGRNTVAGAVNIVTRPATAALERSFHVMAGNHNAREAYANASGKITDELLGRFSFGYEKRDGYTTNLFNNQELDDLKRFSTRGQLSFLATDQLVINLSADYSDIKQNQVLGEAVTGMFDAPLPGGPLASRTVNFNTTPYIKNKLAGANLTASYNMANDHTLTAITGYRDTHQNRQNDTDWSPNDMFYVDYTEDFKHVSQEIRIASPIKDKLRYIAGVYLMHETADTNRVAIVGQDTATLVTHPLAGTVPFGALLGLAPGAVIPVSGRVKTNSYALFGSLDYDLTSKLTFNFGMRYTDERKSMLYNLDGSASGAILIGTAVNYTDGRTDSMLTPTAGVTYALDNSNNLYGKYSSGFKSGGWNLDYLTATQIASKFDFNKETVDSYEIGLKGKSLDHRISYDVSVFHSTFKDFQVFQLANLGAATPEFQLKNAARARSIGAEASLNALVANNLSIGGNIGVLQAKFKSFPSGATTGGDATGKRLPDAPNLTVAVTANYGMPVPSLGGRFDIYGEYNHRGKSYSGVDNIEALDGVSSRNVYNARLTFSSNHTRMKMGLWVRNLFDNSYTTLRYRDFFGNQYIKRGDPRAFGIEGRCSF